MENCDDIGGTFGASVGRRPGAFVVRLTGELDLAAAEAVAGFVADELRHVDRDVIFDLSELDFIDMAGARLFAAAVAAVTRSGFSCSVVSAAPLAGRVIEFSGLADVLGLQPSGTARRQGGDIRARTVAAAGRVPCARVEGTPSSTSSATRPTMVLQATPRRTEAGRTSRLA